MSEVPSHLVVSFSGGIDSSAAAVIAHRTYPMARLDLLYVEMGGGKVPGFRAHLDTAAEAIGGQLHILYPEHSFTELLGTKGWPRFLGPWCQGELNATMGRWVRKHSSPESAWRVIGSRRTQRAAHAGDRPPLQLVGTREWRTWSPAWALGNTDIRFVLQQDRVPVWVGYSMGFYRTSCAFCPGQRPYCYAALRRHHPETFADFSSLCVKYGSPAWWYSSVMVGLTLDEIADAGEIPASHLATHAATSIQGLLPLTWAESCAAGGISVGITGCCVGLGADGACGAVPSGQESLE